MKRRPFIKKVIAGSGGILLTSQLSALQSTFFQGKKEKLGIALVGLGRYSTNQLAPALLETEHCKLTAIVTGTKAKEAIWSEKYGIKEQNIYNYINFDSIAKNDDVDIIYIVLPNSMHAEYTIRAAKAGKHVICEKPMATSAEDCIKMIAACKDANVKLSIGYRLHFDPLNGHIMTLGQNKVYGNFNLESNFSFNLKDPSSWRLNKKLSGGGPLMDIGIYALQSAIYTFGELPISVKAKDTTIDKSFYQSRNIEGSLEWELIFPSGKAVCKSSYEMPLQSYLVAEGEQGLFKLDPAFLYGGLKGETPDGPINIKNVNQQAMQMDAFALNLLNNTETIVPGEMGHRDMYIIEKIYESAFNNSKLITLDDIPKILDVRKV